jgi:hypothetical protein
LRLETEKVGVRLTAMDAALVVRAQELERRLEDLNRLRYEVTQDRSMFVRDDVYREKTVGYDIWCRQVDNRLTTIETRAITWTTAIGTVFMILQIVLHLWGKP